MSNTIQQINGISNLFFIRSMANESIMKQLTTQSDHVLRVTVQSITAESPDDRNLKTVEFGSSSCLNILSKLDQAVDFLRTVLLASTNGTKGESSRVIIMVESVSVLEAGYAILIAVAMQACQIGYSKALQLLRSSFPELQLSTNAERQLRIWEFCEYSILSGVSYKSLQSPPEKSLKMPGAFPLSSNPTTPPSSRRNSNGTNNIYKVPYIAWLKEHKQIVDAERIAIHKQKAAKIEALREEKAAREPLVHEQQEISLPSGQHRSKCDWLKSTFHDHQSAQCHGVYGGLSEHLSVTIKLLT